MAVEWSFAELEPAQTDISFTRRSARWIPLWSAAYAPSRCGTIDPEAVGEHMHPVELEASQLAYLQGLERLHRRGAGRLPAGRRLSYLLTTGPAGGRRPRSSKAHEVAVQARECALRDVERLAIRRHDLARTDP